MCGRQRAVRPVVVHDGVADATDVQVEIFRLGGDVQANIHSTPAPTVQPVMILSVTVLVDASVEAGGRQVSQTYCEPNRASPVSEAACSEIMSDGATRAPTRPRTVPR